MSTKQKKYKMVFEQEKLGMPKPFKEKFTVRDILRLFDILLEPKGSNQRTKLSSDPKYCCLMPHMTSTRIIHDLNLVRNIKSEKKKVKPFSGILVVPSDSISGLFAVSETQLKEEKVLVQPEVRQAFVRTLERRALPNSIYKRPPEQVSSPEATWHEQLAGLAMTQYYNVYGEDKPLPIYPILPPRERPPVEPPQPKKKKKKKGKKGKRGKKHKQEPEPFDMTVWRRQAMPVASTQLRHAWFNPPPYVQYTPDISNPPSPPTGVPEPASDFGHFVCHLPETRHPKRVSNKGHYPLGRVEATPSTGQCQEPDGNTLSVGDRLFPGAVCKATASEFPL